MTNVHAVTITLDDQAKNYTPSFQTEEKYARSWKAVLKSAYKFGMVKCACRGVGAKRLAIKYFAGSDSFSLARFGGSAGEHAADCRFSSDDDNDRGTDKAAAGVIDVQRDGNVKIRLEIGLKIREVDPDRKTTVEGKPRSGGRSQAAIGLSGLLGYLWDQATLNRWQPYWAGKRNQYTTFRRLHSSAGAITAGDVALVDQLLLPAATPDDAEANRNRGRVRAALTDKRRLLLIAPLASYTLERAERAKRDLTISGFHGMPRVFLAEGQWDRICKRFPLVASGWARGHQTVVIAQIEVREREGRLSANLVDAALMSVTAQWIPVESSYEREIANRLVSAGRAFYKPMRYNQDEGEVLPDFVLLDCERGEVPMEVFGRSDETYLARKREKAAYYDRTYGETGWWRWDATVPGALENIPAFPPTARPTA